MSFLGLSHNIWILKQKLNKYLTIFSVDNLPKIHILFTGKYLVLTLFDHFISWLWILFNWHLCVLHKKYISGSSCELVIEETWACYSKSWSFLFSLLLPRWGFTKLFMQICKILWNFGPENLEIIQAKSTF